MIAFSTSQTSLFIRNKDFGKQQQLYLKSGTTCHIVTIDHKVYNDYNNRNTS